MRRMSRPGRALQWACLALAAATLAGCFTSEPRDIRPGAEPPARSEEAGIWMQAREIERRMATSGKLIADDALQQYANDVACRVSPDYCQDITVYVVRKANFNATMLPNGAMSIWSGALVRMTNEAQLATIMGHEIAHFARRHGLRKMAETQATASAAMVGNILTGLAGLGSPATGDLIGLVARGHIAAFSRDMEREADRLGLRMMASSGYDPAAAPRIWRGLVAEKAAADADGDGGIVFLASHPPAEDRMTRLARLSRGRTVEADGPTRARARYRTHIRPHLTTWLRDELDRRRWAKLEVVLGRLDEAGIAPGVIAWARGERFRRRGADGDADRALAAYREAVAATDTPPVAHRELGLMLRERGASRAARTHLTTYLETAEDPPDRAMIRGYIQRIDGEA